MCNFQDNILVHGFHLIYVHGQYYTDATFFLNRSTASSLLMQVHYSKIMARKCDGYESLPVRRNDWRYKIVG